MASPDKHVHTSPEVAATSKSHGEQVPVINSSEKEAGSTQTPIKVTSLVKELEKSESPMRLPARITYDVEDETFPNKSSPTKIKEELSSQPVMEKITRTQSTSLQEKEIFMEEMFKRLEDDNTANISSKKLDESNNLFIHQESNHKTPIYSVGDDDVFLRRN